MPNGGSDCCGTCWFNRRNRGRAGHGHADESLDAFCDIRGIPIENALYTYCANHPHRFPNRESIPIGPAFIDRGHGREVWHPSPDTEEVRQRLLQLVSEIEEQASIEYPIGVYRDELIVRQLGEFREARAIDELHRVICFRPDAQSDGPFPRSRASLIEEAKIALKKIGDLHPSPALADSVPAGWTECIDTMAISLEDRVFGVLFGQAVGDALGLGSEFMSKEDVRWHYPEGLSRYEQIIQDSHRKRWHPGDWTDDTEQMTMIVDSLLETGVVDVCDIGRRISNWVFHAHGVGVGNTVYAVLKHPAFAEDPHFAAREVWESTGKRAAANGGIMRTSALGLWNFHDLKKIRENAEAVCRITHFDPRCVATSVAVALLANHLAKGRAPDARLIAEIRAVVNEYDPRIDVAFEQAASSEIDTLELDAEDAIGYTLKPLAAGLWALAHAKNFEDGLLRVVAEGGDADSNASVACALLGARYGFRAIPTHLIQGLTTRSYLARVGKELLARITAANPDAASNAAVLEMEVGGTLTDDSLVAYVKRLMGQEGAAWTLFARGTVVQTEEGGSDDQLKEVADNRLKAIIDDEQGPERVTCLVYTEGWVVEWPGKKVLTYVHPLEFKHDAPSDTDVVELARFKRGRDKRDRRTIHVEQR